MPYQTGDSRIDQELEKLARKYSSPYTREYIRQLLTSVIKLHLDPADLRDLFLANTTLKELRHIFRVFSQFRQKRKVVIFGSHRSSSSSKEYKLAESFARQIAKKDCMVITGGGPGLMEAGNKGAGRCGFAVKIKLPSEQVPNKYVVKGKKLINVNYFFTRKLTFIKESEATVLFPGGFGTHDEGFEILTLLQTGKAAPRPIVLVESKGKTYWQSWLKFVKKELVGGGYVTKEDLSLFKIVNSAKAAVNEVVNFYRVYHSLRYYRDLTVFRLKKKVPAKVLGRLSKKYNDIVDGLIKPCGPLPVEVRSQEFLQLPRICFKFNRKSVGRLIELIRDLNNAV